MAAVSSSTVLVGARGVVANRRVVSARSTRVASTGRKGELSSWVTIGFKPCTVHPVFIVRRLTALGSKVQSWCFTGENISSRVC